MWGSGFKWLFLIVGTTIGAGYASGRELWQFFGHESVLAIGIFVVLFMVSCYVVLKLSYERKTEHYLPVLEALLGKRISGIYDILIVFYLFSTTAVMYAGGGATLEAFHIQYRHGVLIIGLLVVVLFFWNTRGIVTVNAFLTPGLIILLFSLLCFYLLTTENSLAIDWQHQSNWPSAFTFTALNILPLVAVLSAIGSKIKQTGEIWIASIGSALILGTLSFLYNQTLVLVSNELTIFEIPLFAILQHYPAVMVIVMTILLWFAIYTTAVSGILGLTSRLSSLFKWPWWLLALILTLLMLPLTAIGFSNLIAVLYPLYGVLNLYLLVAILIHPIAKKRSGY